MNAEQASKQAMQEPTWLESGKAAVAGGDERRPEQSCRGSGGGMHAKGDAAQHGKPQGVVAACATDQQPARVRLGPLGWRTGSHYRRSRVIPGGKGPEFKPNVHNARARRVA